MPQVGSLSTSLTLESQQFTVGLKRAAEQTRTSVANIEKGFNQLKVAAQATAAVLALDAVADAATRGLDYASSLGEVSQQLGVTTADLQIYRFAASQAGIEQETMDKALAKLTVTLGKARDGAKGPADAFKELSVLAGRDIVGSAQSAGDAIPLIADALAKIEDPAKRARLEVELFGKAGQKLDTLLAGGRGQIDELRDAAQRLGVVIDDKFIQQADEAADKLAAMKRVLEARIAGAVAENADSIVKLADSIFRLVGGLTQLNATDLRKYLTLAGAGSGALLGARLAGLPGAAAGAFLGGVTGGNSIPVSNGERIAQLRERQKFFQQRGYRFPDQAKLDTLLAQRRAEFVNGLASVPEAVARFRTEGLPTPPKSFGGVGSRPKTASQSRASKDVPDPNEWLQNAMRDTQEALEIVNRNLARDWEKAKSDAARQFYENTGLDPAKEMTDIQERILRERDSRLEAAEEVFQKQADLNRELANQFGNLFRGNTDQIWRDFKSLGIDVLASLAAQFTLAKLTGQKFNLSSAFQLGVKSLGIPGFAKGGRPRVGQLSLVGEEGPELFRADVPGTIIPNHALGRGGGGVMRVEIVDTTGLFVTRVQEVTTPMIVQVGQATVVAGAGLARKQLAKAASQRLGR